MRARRLTCDGNRIHKPKVWEFGRSETHITEHDTDLARRSGAQGQGIAQHCFSKRILTLLLRRCCVSRRKTQAKVAAARSMLGSRLADIILEKSFVHASYYFRARFQGVRGPTGDSKSPDLPSVPATRSGAGDTGSHGGCFQQRWEELVRGAAPDTPAREPEVLWTLPLASGGRDSVP